MAKGTATLKMAMGLIGELGRWARRVPTDPGDGTAEKIHHSSDIRMAIIALTTTELLAEGLTDVILPPALRIVHIFWMVVLALLACGLVASIARRPHLVNDDTLLVRAGPLGEIAVPLTRVRAVRTEMVSTKGYGLRAAETKGVPTAVCSIGGTTQVTVELTEPLLVTFRKGEPQQVERVCLACDRTGAAAALLRTAVARAAARADTPVDGSTGADTSPESR